MDKQTLRSKITDVLQRLGAYSADAVELLLGTCAQESAFGKYRKQLGGGPALGIFQMEPDTFNDIVKNYLAYRPELESKILSISGVTELKATDVENNDDLAICMARVHYMRVKEGVPSTLEGQANYWKKYYNTVKGAGTVEEYIANYNRYVK